MKENKKFSDKVIWRNERFFIPIKNLIYNFFDKIGFFLKGKLRSRNISLVIGSPRSGTTILYEVLFETDNYFPIYEPFHYRYHDLPISDIIGRINRFVIKEEIKMEQYLDMVFNGKFKEKKQIYPLKIKILKRKLLADKILIKSVRINRIVDYIINFWNIDIIYYIIRNPFSTIASQLKNKVYCYNLCNHPPNSKILSSEIDYMKKIGINPQIISKLNSAFKNEEILALSWCLDNLIFLRNNLSKLKVIQYESLNERGIDYLKKYVKIYKEKKIRKILDKPSQSVNFSSDFNKKQLRDKWKDELNNQQIKNISNIIKLFGYEFDNNGFLIQKNQYCNLFVKEENM